MFFDLHTPFPSPSHAFLTAASSQAAGGSASGSGKQAKKSKKGKDKEQGSASAGPADKRSDRDCWWGIADSDRQRVEEQVLLTRHRPLPTLCCQSAADSAVTDSLRYDQP